ncbi:AAA family ATPase [Listeria grandensis]|uniref:Nuclease SbcCD subunit C n=1 Tax=Listeria grandensis TaxID=1494963 RepID=A0A7X0Y1X9_9LIST|nr:AAA family ATPase [Listeria grandensis]MBC1935223.1 AAA family ATPase [Listeria grandensis]
MKNIRLINLKLRNFKGIKEFELASRYEENLAVYGANGTGKTSIFDAFTWLLFDKDSQNKKDFSIKTRDENGEEIHFLEHEVSAVLSIAMQHTELKKVYKEKWTKKTGAIDKEFTGHTTDYYINDVKAKKKEYMDFVSDLIDENTFKMITSPSFFSEQLKWQEQRDVVMTIAGNVTDEEVIQSNPELAELTDLLRARSVDDARKIALQKRKDVNEQLQNIPVRIDEAARNMPDVSELDQQLLTDEIQALELSKDEKHGELQNIRSGSHAAELVIQKTKIEGELQEIKNRHQSEVYAATDAKRQDISNLKGKIASAEGVQRSLQDTFETLTKAIEVKTHQKTQLEQHWYAKKHETFDEHRATCPTCEQTFPPDKLDQMIANFNNEKTAALEKIVAEGQTLKEQIENNQNQLNFEETARKTVQEELQNLCVDLALQQEQLDDMEANATKVENTGEYVTKYQELEEVKKQIENGAQSSTVRESEVRNEIGGIENEIATLRTDLSKFETISNINARIEELKKEQAELAELFNECEKMVFLTNKFTQAKANLLEGRINDKFELVRFKLFRALINGGLEECCEATVDGVPYTSGLNTASRINGGLDIINSLNEHYQVAAPIFIDNRESVTELIKTKSQVISLIVSEDDKTLKVSE